MAFSEEDKKKLEVLFKIVGQPLVPDGSRPPESLVFGAGVQDMVMRHFLDSYAEGLEKLEKKGPAGKELKDELAAEVAKSFLSLRRPGRIMESRAALGMPNLIPQAGLERSDVTQDAVLTNSIPDFNRQMLKNTVGIKDSSGIMGYKAGKINEPEKAQAPDQGAMLKTMEDIMRALMDKEGVKEFDLEVEQQSYSDPKSTGPDWIIPSGRYDTGPITVSGSKQDVKTTKTKKRVE